MLEVVEELEVTAATPPAVTGVVLVLATEDEDVLEVLCAVAEDRIFGVDDDDDDVIQPGFWIIM